LADSPWKAKNRQPKKARKKIIAIIVAILLPVPNSSREIPRQIKDDAIRIWNVVGSIKCTNIIVR
jgi:hypothetical protein